jgi:hypothetical protein
MREGERMDLKHAIGVCLIATVSATLVMLIARGLDSQAASRLEPQLTSIAEHLEALRRGGGLASSGPVDEVPEQDQVVVYYFHGNTRCPTCRNIESQAHEAVTTEFASELDRGELVWRVVNYERTSPATAELVGKFGIQIPNVVVARRSGGEPGPWKRLDQVWTLVGDKPAFREFVVAEVRGVLAAGDAESVPTAHDDDDDFDIPIPNGE